MNLQPTEHDILLAAAKHAESERLLQLRLNGFVGRTTEQAAIQALIEQTRPRGGYVLVTGGAGVGKSSLIAQLIVSAGLAQTPHHFIALTPGRNYQLDLLRSVVAQLMLKHHLEQRYFPADNYSALRLEFGQIVHELSTRGISETIYLDGLDQLQPEVDGTRDISFLPLQLPPGIVIVLGSRPDERIDRLGLEHGVNYAVPALSTDDVITRWQQVQPSVEIAALQQLANALAGNALMVELAASLIIQCDQAELRSLIAQVGREPSNLFRLSLKRIEHQSPTQWSSVIRPLLAVLVVTQEPLLPSAIAILIEQPADLVIEALDLMNDWVTAAVDQRLALRHLLFHEYLVQAEFSSAELRAWHQRFATWCGVELDTIWQDSPTPAEQARRWYARHHMMTHLALAEQWAALWQLVDTGDYGAQKVRFDPSTRLYGLDLDRARESVIVAHQHQAVDDQLASLPRLWRYSLLRTSLTAHADQWHDDMFAIVAASGFIAEALAQIEICSDPSRQVRLWQSILTYAAPERRLPIIQRMEQVARSLRDADERDKALGSVAMAYIEQELFSLGYSIMLTLEHFRDSWRYSLLQNRLEHGDISQAHMVMAQIEAPKYQVKSAILIAKHLIATADHEQAYSLLTQVLPLADEGDLIKVQCLLANVHWHAGNDPQAQALLVEAEAGLQHLSEWAYGDGLDSIMDTYLTHRDQASAQRLAESTNDYRYLFTTLYLKHGDSVTAAKYASMIDKDGYRNSAHTKLIEWYCQQADFESAQTLLSLMLSAGSQHEAACIVARAYAERQQFVAFEATLTMTIDTAPNDDDIYGLIGIAELYASYGFDDQACAVLARVFPLIARLSLHRQEGLPEWVEFAQVIGRYGYPSFYDQLLKVVFIREEEFHYATALAKMAQCYANYGEFARAEQLIQAIRTTKIAVNALKELALIAHADQLATQAVHYVHTAHSRLRGSEDEAEQIELLGMLATTAWSLGLTDLNQLLMAEGRQLLTQLPQERQVYAANDLIDSYQAQQNATEALAIAQSIHDPEHYQRLIERVIDHYIEAQDLNQAYYILTHYQTAGDQYKLSLHSIAIAAREQGQIELASQTCAELMFVLDDYTHVLGRLNMLKNLAINQLTYGSDASLPLLLDRLRTTDPQTVDLYSHVMALCEIAAVYAQQSNHTAFAEWLHLAHSVAKQAVRSARARLVSLAYETLAKTYLAYADDAAIQALLEEHCGVAQICAERGDQSFALMVLSKSYAHYAHQKQPRFRAEAYQIALTIPDPWDAANALTTVAKAYVVAGDHAVVQTIITQILQREHNLNNDAMIDLKDVPCKLALVYIEQGDFAHAYALIAGLGPSYHKDKALNQLIAHCLQSDQLDQAYTFSHEFEYIEERSVVVEQIIRVYSDQQQWAARMQTLQVAWRRCRHTYDLWTLSTAILPLLPSERWLGTALLDSLPWVEQQLQRYS
ncbi:AAA family ATPase [Herpetosiphon sp. NSE202]|uniref:AAA family ATPase n=1 Tax=Herpetosiphon sp. NSE202 TaxID=3351349 RepID=UPI003644FDE8